MTPSRICDNRYAIIGAGKIAIIPKHRILHFQNRSRPFFAIKQYALYRVLLTKPLKSVADLAQASISEFNKVFAKEAVLAYRHTSTMAPWFIQPKYTPILVPPDGVFIVDSFGMTGKNESRMLTYVPWVLEYVYKHTGMLCVAAVCCEGYENIGYTELMHGAEEVTRRRRVSGMTWGTALSFCVIISMGKDVYKLTKDMPRVYGDIECEAIAQGMRKVYDYCRTEFTNECLMVYGGTQVVWGYDKWFGDIYDKYVHTIVQNLRSVQVEVVKGIHLGKLRTLDGIGHVHEASLEQVARMWILWANMAGGRPMKQTDQYPRVSYPRSKL